MKVPGETFRHPDFVILFLMGAEIAEEGTLYAGSQDA